MDEPALVVGSNLLEEPNLVAEPNWELLTPLPSKYVIGKGQIQSIRGQLNWPGHRLQSMNLLEPQRDGAHLQWTSVGQTEQNKFEITIPWAIKDLDQTRSISIQITDDQQQRCDIELGNIHFLDFDSPQVQPGRQFGDDPLIAICMASYQPGPDRFLRQIESILCQSYENWVLIISDDASDAARVKEIRAICNMDPRRIRLIENDRRVGFYHNFERALCQVPQMATMVALADQDDAWYPQKLRKLAQRLSADDAPVLAYSDMRIVDDKGTLLANSFWGQRKNEYQDFDSLFLNNTLTGAAALFKYELLSTLLPFPEKVGEMFHDHWLGCVARSIGKLAYIDAPLYDYYQYPDAVVGHCATPTADQALEPSTDKWVKREQGYANDCLRLQRIANTLKLRCPQLKGNSSLNLMNGGLWSVIKLVKTYLKGRLLGRTRGGVELGLIMGLLAHQRKERKV